MDLVTRCRVVLQVKYRPGWGSFKGFLPVCGEQRAQFVFLTAFLGSTPRAVKCVHCQRAILTLSASLELCAITTIPCGGGSSPQESPLHLLAAAPGMGSCRPASVSHSACPGRGLGSVSEIPPCCVIYRGFLFIAGCIPRHGWAALCTHVRVVSSLGCCEYLHVSVWTYVFIFHGKIFRN